MNFVEIFVLGSHFVWVAQQRTHEPLVQGLERDDVLAVDQHHPSDRDLVHLPDGLADHREGVVPDLAVGPQIVRSDQIARIDLAAIDEFVDLDGPGRFQRHVLKLLLRHLDEGVGVDLVAFDDVLVGDLLASIRVHLHVLDAMTGLSVELVEGDLLGLRRGRVERDGTGDERKAQEAFPIGAGGHGTQNSVLAAWTQDERRPLVPTPRPCRTDLFLILQPGRTRHLFSLCSNSGMTDRSASWRMPTPKQMEKQAIAAAARGNVPPTSLAVGPADELPPEYWQAVLDEVEAEREAPGPSIRTQRLADIQRHLLRVACRRCGRTVEIQKADATRLYGEKGVWKDVGQRLLDNTCQQRTGRHEEDGCWPSFE